MAKHYSTERVERDGYLVYAVGAPIPESDTDEIERQGLVKQASKPANKSRSAPANKQAKTSASKQRPALNGTTDEWAGYATALGVEFDSDAGRDDIIAAVDEN